VRSIDATLVDEVWREMMSYPAGRIEGEAHSFLAQQPHAAVFAQAITAGYDPVVKKAAFGLSFLLFKVAEKSLGHPVPALSEARIREAHEAATTQREASAPGSPPSPASSSDPGHPALVLHILSTLYGDDHPTEYDEGVRTRFVLLLTTLSDALALGQGDA
jgi:hypothetical protein